MSDCDFTTGTCPVCGFRGRRGLRRNCIKPKMGLGDFVEKALSNAGITKERVQAVTGKPCGCKRRQEAMNLWGYRAQQRMFRPVAWLINRWQFVKYSRPVMRVSEACRYFRMGFHVLLFGESHR